MSSFQIRRNLEQEVRNARMVGEFVVKVGMAKLPGMVWQFARRVGVVPPANPVHRATFIDTQLAQVESPIPQILRIEQEPTEGYDVLTTQQVLELIPLLDTMLLEAIKQYELSHRGRTSVLQALSEQLPQQ